MLKKSNDILIVHQILKNIRDEDKQELMALFSEEWYLKTIESFKNKEFLVLYGFDDKKLKVPIAIGGIDEVIDKHNRVASVWFLSTKWIKNNKRLLFSTLKNQILLAEKDYDILFNFIYKSNLKLKSWLEKLGFVFGDTFLKEFPPKKGFEFFYKFIERN
ncbi:MAG: hypothetical protein IJY61_01065 [Candidatus Gastranaerophilales bacterium]|nr:hypothetical protein [Candidatus Gastranaerophilales bacterium]